MKSPRPRRPSACRNGYSRIELIVVVLLLFTFLAILFPMLQRSRTPARRSECRNRIRNLAIAMRNVSTNNNNRLPSIDEKNRNWAIALLPALNQTEAYRSIVNQGEDPQIVMDTFTCPDNHANSKQPNGLSFVVNGGYTNWPAGTTDFAKTRASGVCFLSAPGTGGGRSVTYEEIEQADGQEQTILILEQTIRGSWRVNAPSNHFAQIDVQQIGAGTCTSAGPATPIIPGRMDSPVLKSLRLAGVNTACMSGLNGSLASCAPASIQGRAPSSNHSGVVHVAFASGAARGISDAVDAQVFLRLITHNGTSGYRQQPVDDNSY